jgi:hypothetical protein
LLNARVLSGFDRVGDSATQRISMRTLRHGLVGPGTVFVAVVLAVVMDRPALAAPATAPDTVQVFFSHDPESFNDFTAVFPLPRDVADGDLMERAIAALIVGPSAAEQANGYFSFQGNHRWHRVQPRSVSRGRSNRRANARSTISTPARRAGTWPIVATSSSCRNNRKSGSNA